MDYASTSELDEGYEIDSPDADTMVLDAVVGIMDPLRADVTEAVATAQSAGVMVSVGGAGQAGGVNWRFMQQLYGEGVLMFCMPSLPIRPVTKHGRGRGQGVLVFHRKL